MSWYWIVFSAVLLLTVSFCPRMLRRWRLMRFRCPWCGSRLLRPAGILAPAETMTSLVTAVCRNGHYARERTVQGQTYIYDAGGKPIDAILEAFEETLWKRGDGRPRRRRPKEDEPG